MATNRNQPHFEDMQDGIDAATGREVAVSLREATTIYHRQDCGNVSDNAQLMPETYARQGGLTQAPCLQGEGGDE